MYSPRAGKPSTQKTDVITVTDGLATVRVEINQLEKDRNKNSLNNCSLFAPQRCTSAEKVELLLRIIEFTICRASGRKSLVGGRVTTNNCEYPLDIEIYCSWQRQAGTG
ncbi:hypothetical protein SCLCIDRAFT_1101045 [Scleroderma citrinum Foug A]|uniref:Uncharacterized protein n=1 Tax=Scleroderma citrinum Foug A TaxID=1036808 RepID=A0A0C2Z875_9AGAM|nr:hypothetical protein SCLCIDRAFT_1101045 [Scleroderma citrinum Foug A]